MKNLLSENMLRFGTKNLSESAKKDLIVKSIMETIDQHGLRREIKRKLSEQTEVSPMNPVVVSRFKFDTSDISFKNPLFNPADRTQPPIQDDIKISVEPSTKNPSVFSVSFTFTDMNGKPVTMRADVEKTPQRTYAWRTSFKNYTPGSNITGLLVSSSDGKFNGQEVAKLFQMMANPNKPENANLFIKNTLTPLGFQG
jgi:hypothetical protein